MTENINKEIGERIRLRRIELNMSQVELSEKVGYKSKSSVNLIELGKRNITQNKIVDFANALNTTPSYLMGWEDDSNQQLSAEENSKLNDAISTIEEILHIDNLNSLLRNFIGLNKEQQKEIVLMADTIYSKHQFSNQSTFNFSKKRDYILSLEKEILSKVKESLSELNFEFQCEDFKFGTPVKQYVFDAIFVKNDIPYFFEIKINFNNDKNTLEHIINDINIRSKYTPEVYRYIYFTNVLIPDAQSYAKFLNTIIWCEGENYKEIYFPSKEVEEEFYRK